MQGRVRGVANPATRGSMLSKHQRGERGCTKAGRGREEEGSRRKRGWKAGEWIPCSLNRLG